MESALRFREYQHWGSEPIVDQDTVLGVRQAGESDYLKCRPTDAKEIFKTWADSMEKRLGLMNAQDLGSRGRAKSPKRPGPKGPRESSIARRAAIRTLKAKGIKGLEACKRLNTIGIPLPAKNLQTFYNNDWVSWFQNDSNGFYRQWSADLKRL